MQLRPPETPPPRALRDTGAVRARRLSLLAFALLLLIAAGVVFVLPETTGENPVQVEPAAPIKKGSSPTPQPGASVQAQAREDAQRSLGEALGFQARLSASRAQEWAAEAHEAAMARITAGDAAFADGDFVAANTAYREASDLMRRIEASKAQRFADALGDGRQALASLDAAGAMAAFSRAAAMDPASDEVRSGLARAGSFEQVLAQYRRALDAEAAGELESALSLLQQTVALDEAFADAATAQARVQAAIDERDFRDAMSRALAALSRGEWKTARSALSRARKLRPSDPSVADARRRLAQADQQAQMRRLEKQALTLEQEERWKDAAGAYEKALKVDPQAAFARRGLARSRERQRLNERVTAYLSDPSLLQADESLHDAQLLLEAASTGETPGPALASRLERLQALVRGALTPVTVLVRSDGATAVTILRVSRLGPVNQRALALRPGRYVATGSRAGFRDVRVAFTVPAGEASVTVTVICTEPV